MHKKHENQHWNKGIAMLLMALMIALPAEYAYAQAIVDVSGQQFSNIGQDVISDFTEPPSSEEMIGEDILINVNHYDPPVISTTLIEDQGANVFALLEGNPTNPTIDIAGIRRIITRPVKITTIPPNKPVSIGSIQHITPRSTEISYDNLGYLVVPIRRIPREADVPDQIDIDMVSRIYFDVSAGLSAGPYEDVLVKQEYQQWLQNKDDHSFYAGYIRADEITPTSATFTLYDKNLQEFGTYTAKEGSTSSIINTYRRGYASTGRLFDKLRIRVNEIRGRDDKVRMYVTQDDVTSYKILSKGQRIAPRSSWYVADIKISQDKSEVVLKNEKQQSETFVLKQVISASNATVVSEEQDKTLELMRSLEQSIAEKCSPSKIREDIEGCNREAAKVMNNPAITNSDSVTVRNKAYAIVTSLRSTYIEYQRELQTKSDPKSSSDLASIDQMLLKSDSFMVSVENNAPKEKQNITSSEALQKAKQSYQRIIDEHPDSDEAPRAMFRLGKIYWQENNIPLALQTFERIVSMYDEEELSTLQVTEGVSSNYIARVIRDLHRAKDSLTTTSGMKNLQERDGTITAVTIIEVDDVLPDSEAAVKIRINNQEHTYRLGNVLTLGMSDAMDWEITNVKDNEVTITSRPKNNATQSTTTTLRIGSARSIQTKENNKEEKINVELISTDLQREVHVVVEPASEQAFSEAHYTLHLPIEKRPFGLPLFSDSLDAEITKTEKLLAKLDKLIQQATDIHETWTKFCYVAYGWIWLKNTLWFGKGKETVARNKVNEVYKEKYAANQLDCEGLSYEQCIMQKYGDEYESDMDLTEDIIDEFDSTQYKEFTQQFQLDDSYDEDKKNLYMYKRLHEEKGGTDEGVAQKYFTGLKNLKVRSTENKIVQGFYTDKKLLKEYGSLNAEQKSAVAATVQKMPSLQGISVDEAYNKNKENILRNYKEERVSQDMRAFFDTELASANDGVERKVITDLETSYFRPPITKTELPKSLIMKSGGQYYVALNGNTYMLTDVDDAKYNQPMVTTSAIGDTTYVFTENVKEAEHRKIFTLGSSGSEKGRVEFLTVDALHYIQVSYTDAGRVNKMQVFQRPEANGPIGTEGDIRLQEYNEAMEYAKKNDPQLYNKLVQAQSCLTNINKKAAASSFKQGDKDIAQCADGSYSVGTAAKEVTSSCIEYMSPDDCKLMFNACDPVICPATRCNFGGDWQVDNVVQTGIIGSTVLCIRNFPEVVMPICITGIVAGLQNLRSIVAGYKECLITSKVEGRSVGICDKVRSFGICEILWREGIAIFNVKEGIFRAIAKTIVGEPEGGGEYAEFTQNMDNSVNTLKYFTQSYAKNVFAQYNGGALPEVGAAICKSAIYGKVPGIGNFFDQITRPESPPQFTAFFEEIPFSDIPTKPISQYNLFYHIYAGENQDVRFSIFLQTKDLTGQTVLPPWYLFRNRPLPRGEFASESLSLQRPSGYEEICMEIDSPNYGRDVQCGFGKVSTSFSLNWMNDQFTQSELRKNIDSEEECMPSTGRITSYQYQGNGEYAGGSDTVLGEAARIGVGSFSTGFLQTGIVRKCSQYDPDVGTTQDNWVPVGTCGKDERGRNLGECYLHQPSALELVKDASGKVEVTADLNERTQDVIEQVQKDLQGPSVLDDKTIQEYLREAKTIAKDTSSSKEDLEHAVLLYNEVFSSSYVEEKQITEALYWMGRAYERIAVLATPKVASVQPTPVTPQQGPVLKATFPEDKIRLENIGSEIATNVILSLSIRTLKERLWLPDSEKKIQVRSITMANIASGENKEEEYNIDPQLLSGVNKYQIIFEYLADNIPKKTLTSEWKTIEKNE